MDLHHNIFYAYRGPEAASTDRDRQLENNLTKALMNTLRLGGEAVWRPFLAALGCTGATGAKFLLQRGVKRGRSSAKLISSQVARCGRRAPTMALVFALEGITVQHAAELLLDFRLTESDRRTCRSTYLRSLADFTFGLLAGDVIAVSQRLPKVGEDRSPGQELLEVIARQLPGHIRWIEDEGTGDPGVIREDVAQRTMTRSWIGKLEDALVLDGPSWQEHLVREFKAYAGDDPQLAEDLPPERYPFRRRFWYDKELEDAIPSRTVERAFPPRISVLTADGREVHANARAAFVRRNIVAHILIWQWYQEQMIRPKFAVRERNLVTHVTRASLVSAKRRGGGRDGRREGWRIIVPRVLAGLINRSETRSDLIKHILDAASDSAQARTFRRTCEDAIEEYVAGNDVALERLQRDLEAWARGSDVHETFECRSTIGWQAGSPKAEFSTALSGAVASSGYLEFDRSMRFLTRAASRFADYEVAAERLFKEIRAAG